MVVVGHEAGVDRGTRGADGCAELVGDALQDDEVVAALHAAAAGNDDAGGGQLRALRPGELLPLEDGKAGVAGAGDVLDGGGAALGRGGVEGGGADRDRKSTRLNSSH